MTMAAMNVATQRRLGKLPKTEDSLSYKGHMYGNTHRGFRGRRPTSTYEGFYGYGGPGGDGKLHYYGNGEGQSDLPMNGFYGLGSAELDFQAAEMLIPGNDGASTHNPTHKDTPGMYGAMDIVTGSTQGVPNVLIGIAAVLLYKKFY